MVKVTALLNTPFCRTCALPEVEPVATVATTCPSLQLVTTPVSVPSQTLPLPCVAPKPDPVIVTCVPGRPLVGDTALMDAVFTVNGTGFEVRPLCSISAAPDIEPVFTVAITWVSLQLTTVPRVLPSTTIPVPCDDPNPEPVTDTCVPAEPLVGDTLATVGAAGTTGVVTVTDVLPLMLPKLAVMLAVPTATGATIPGSAGFGITSATDALDVPQVTLAVRSLELPSE